VKAVVFDMDGVIVNSEPLHLRAFQTALVPFGVTITQEEYYRTYVAFTDREVVGLVLPDRPEAAARALAEKQRIFEGLCHDAVHPFPDTLALIRRLPPALPMALATGAIRAEAEHALRLLGLRERFAALVAAEDCRRTKPDPEPYRLAAERLDVAPRDCLAVEDTREGIRSARGAGMVCVGVAHTHPAPLLAEADVVVETLDALDVTEVARRFWPNGRAQRG
jgi:HAD superfamily hydrolase (TIGR01509 family)